MADEDLLYAQRAAAVGAQAQVPDEALYAARAQSTTPPAPAIQSQSQIPWWMEAAGPAEATAQALTGLAGSAAGGIAGLGTLATTGDAGAAADKIRAFQNAMTYQPRTQSGQWISGVAGLPGKAADYLTQKEVDILGPKGLGLANSPEAQGVVGAATNTALNVLPSLFGKNPNVAPAEMPRIEPTAPTPLGLMPNEPVPPRPGPFVQPPGVPARPVSMAGQGAVPRGQGVVMQPQQLSSEPPAPQIPPPPTGLRGVVAPFTNPESIVGPYLAQTLGNDPATIARLQNAQGALPGFTPTTAQVIGTPAAVQVEKSFRRTPETQTQFAQRDADNNAAVMQNLQQFGGSPEQIQAAIQARRQAVDQWVNPQTGILHTSGPVDATPVIDALSKLEQSGLAVRPQVRGAISDINGILQKNTTPGPGGQPLVTPDILDAVRQNTNEILKKYDPHGAVDSQASAALGPVQNAIVSTLDGQLPGYRNYLATYAQASVPINTMEAVNQFRDWAGNRPLVATSTGESVPQLDYLSTQQKLAQALQQPYGVSPEAQAAIAAARSDMQRATLSNSLRTAGSDTSLNVQTPGYLAGKIYGENFSGPSKTTSAVAAGTGAAIGSTLGGVLFGAPGIAGGTAAAKAATYGLNKASAAGASRVNSMIAQALLDPQYAAKLIQGYGVPKQ